MKKINLFFFTLLVLLSGCTNVKHLQDLKVDLISITPSEIQSMSPRFTINLLVTNPNAEDLQIEGMNFQLDIAGNELITGVSADIPTLKAYSETKVSVDGSVSIFDFINLLRLIANKTDTPIEYELNTMIDPKGFIAFNLHHQGVLDDLLMKGLK